MVDIKWIVEPDANDDDDAVEFIVLPTFKNDTRRVVTMRHPGGHIVGPVRVDSLVHWLMIKHGYRVVQS